MKDAIPVLLIVLIERFLAPCYIVLLCFVFLYGLW